VAVSHLSADPVTDTPRAALDFVLGRALAGSAQPLTRTAADLTAASKGCVGGSTTQAQGSAYARALRGFGVRHVVTLGDSGARSRLFTHGLRDRHRLDVVVGDPAARSLHIPAEAAVVVSTDEPGATRILERLARDTMSSRGIYLAPWLLDGSVLQRAASLRLPLVSVGSVLGPTAPIADDYRAAVVASVPGLRPSIAGLFGYLSAADPAATIDPRLVIYAASPVGFLPGILDVGHEHAAPGAWFTTGTLTPISNPVRVVAHCLDLPNLTPIAKD
jgi:hypothetical protein